MVLHAKRTNATSLFITSNKYNIIRTYHFSLFVYTNIQKCLDRCYSCCRFRNNFVASFRPTPRESPGCFNAGTPLRAHWRDCACGLAPCLADREGDFLMGLGCLAPLGSLKKTVMRRRSKISKLAVKFKVATCMRQDRRSAQHGVSCILIHVTCIYTLPMPRIQERPLATGLLFGIIYQVSSSF